MWSSRRRGCIRKDRLASCVPRETGGFPYPRVGVSRRVNGRNWEKERCRTSGLLVSRWRKGFIDLYCL